MNKGLPGSRTSGRAVAQREHDSDPRRILRAPSVDERSGERRRDDADEPERPGDEARDPSEIPRTSCR